MNSKRTGWPLAIWLGLVLTAVWLLGVGFVCWRQWTDLVSALPNNIGDFAAGATAPLAFLWLVVAVFLQMQELRDQRNESRALREEWEKQTSLREREDEFRRREHLAEGIEMEIQLLARDLSRTLKDECFAYKRGNGDRKEYVYVLCDRPLVDTLVDRGDYLGAIMAAGRQISDAAATLDRRRTEVVEDKIDSGSLQALSERIQKLIIQSDIPHARLSRQVRGLGLHQMRDDLIRLSKLGLSA